VADALDEVLRRAQDLGFLGPRPVAAQRHHAEALCTLALAGFEPAGEHGVERPGRSTPKEAPLGAPTSGGEYLDLGSGGGLPGLVLAGHPGAAAMHGSLLDSQRRRATFLAEAIERLGLRDRLAVVAGRAEDVARDPAHRERYTLVISRGFASPPVTAECAVGYLRPGGRLVVSEPPEPEPGRWDQGALAELGFGVPELVARDETHAAILHRTGPLDPRWPRKSGVPKKRPLW